MAFLRLSHPLDEAANLRYERLCKRERELLRREPSSGLCAGRWSPAGPSR